MLKHRICISFLAFAFLSFNANAAITSYTTGNGQLRITHNTADEGLYYDCNSNEIAQNVQILKADANTYYTIYHSEPKKTPGSAYPGDSIKTATQTGSFTYSIPSTRTFRIFGHPTDTSSTLYSALTYDLNTASSGGANPMVVKGETDPNYYMLFMACDANNIHSGPYFRRFLCEAKTPDFSSFYLRTLISRTVVWKLFNESVDITWRRPDFIYDTGGSTAIRSIRATDVSNTKGLTGSLCYYNGNYYYFYTDVNTDGRTYLYYRTITNIGSFDNADWSTATRVISSALMDDAVVRVAKAKDMDRWAVIYNGYKDISGDLYEDIFLQYTENMNIIGSDGISSLQLYERFEDGYSFGISHYYLGLVSGDGGYAQHYYMTDPNGNLASPTQEPQNFIRGGLLTWADSSDYGNNVYWAKWNLSYTTNSFFIPADIDDDGDVDFKDLKEVTDSWLITDPTADLCVDSDNTINFKDFSVLNDLWNVNRGWLAELTSPDITKALPATTATFQWSAGYNVQEYYLKVGTTGVGSSNIFAGSTGTNQSQYVTGLPGNGGTVYVRIQSKINGVWCYNDYTYTGLTYNIATMISPANGTELQTSTVTFIWNKSTEPGATNYWVDAGTTPGGWDINDSGQLGSDVNSWTCYNIPINGNNVYVKLSTKINSVWYGNNYVYSAIAGSPAVITSPANRTNLTNTSVLFTWTTGTGVTEYNLQVGTLANPTQYDNYTTTTGTSRTVSSLPTDGRKIYVKLRSKINSAWQENNYTYTALKNAPAGSAHSYLTAGNRIMVYHNTSDENLFFDAPLHEVAYTMQIIKESNSKYYIVYHGEPNKPNAKANLWWGDGLKVAIRNGLFNYTMPSTRKHDLWSSQTDGLSRMWSSDTYSDYTDLKLWRTVSGPGNPMVVKGPTDSYYYINFIICTDTDGNRHLTTYDEGDFTHFLALARTTSFTSYEMRTELPAPDGICWKTFGVNYTWNRPRCLDDTTGAQLTCRRRDYTSMETNGMLGSICYYNGNYYYFYCDDYNVSGQPSTNWRLYYRWTPDIDELTAATSWSAAIQISTNVMGYGQLVKVAPAYDMDRWAVIYHGVQDNGGTIVGDICVQYTQNMNIIGTGGISDIQYFSNPAECRDNHYLGRAIGLFPTTNNPGMACYQHYFMTDPAGRLAVPDNKPQNATSGGLVTFADHWAATGNKVWGGDIYCMGWNLYVPQATVPSPADGATGISASVILSWSAGYKATNYNIYFGTSSNPPYVTNQVETTYDPPGSLQSGVKYYWRIDAINGDDASVTTGKIWNFTVQ